MNNSDRLDRIEAILAEIERLDRATGGIARQDSDKQALLTARRIEGEMRKHQSGKQKNASNG